MARRIEDDVMARAAAETRIRDLTEDAQAVGKDFGTGVVGTFEAVQFETTTTRVQGQDIRLRRLVLTTAWEVDPEAK